MSSIIPLKFNHSSIRVIDKDGETWFMAKAVADALPYSKASAITRLDDDEKGMQIIQSLGGSQELQAY
ncbi:BRO-N domain-containing protein [Spartinivicinus poritis]|uniref:BRO family protein n=1 Tax=Spartinivicinus poritis TaxID=2994640 RepID=A0ABT5UA75_9GAMM|nr:BRO family protein [Spartinivicinus sp. A2-2]MDE1462901.1 BRO family protein [Spartinivicinus sp. A2-2]